MSELGIAGAAARRKRPRTTVPAPAGQERPSDLLERDFTVVAPARRRVADITYVDTASGFVYTAFVLQSLFHAECLSATCSVTAWYAADVTVCNGSGRATRGGRGSFRFS